VPATIPHPCVPVNKVDAIVTTTAGQKTKVEQVLNMVNGVLQLADAEQPSALLPIRVKARGVRMASGMNTSPFRRASTHQARRASWPNACSKNWTTIRYPQLIESILADLNKTDGRGI
jgi:hypothetical protein